MKSERRDLYLLRIHPDEIHAIGGAIKDEWSLQLMRSFASMINYPAQCRLPACRRHKFCCGRMSPAQRGTGYGYHSLFPPCTNGDEERRQAILRQYSKMLDQARARHA